MTLIAQLLLSLQSCLHANVMDFFQFENKREPPGLADRGSLGYGKKSNILQCLNAPTGHAVAAKEPMVMVLDMVAVIHMVGPTNAKIFSEYATLHILPFLEAQMKGSIQCLDAVWDI